MSLNEPVGPGPWILEPTDAAGEVWSPARNPGSATSPEQAEEIHRFFDNADSSWSPPSPWVIETEVAGKPRAFRLFGGLTVSVDIWRAISTCLEDFVDTFPVVVNGLDCVVLKGKHHYDSLLNVDTSTVRRYEPGGRIMQIKSYSFNLDDAVDVFHDSSGKYRLFVTGSTFECLIACLTGEAISDLRLSDVSVLPPRGRPAW